MRRLFPSQRIRPGTKIVRCVVVEPSITPSAYKLRLGGCCSAWRNVRLPTASPSLIGSLQPLSVLLLFTQVYVSTVCAHGPISSSNSLYVYTRRGELTCAFVCAYAHPSPQDTKAQLISQACRTHCTCPWLSPAQVTIHGTKLSRTSLGSSVV